MARAVSGENARINRRCADALDALKARGFPCRGDLPYRAHAACSHVRYGTRLDKHATKTMKRFTAACPASGFDGLRRRKRRR